MKTVRFMGGRRTGHGMGMGEGTFCRGLPFGIRRFKPMLPFLGGRSDAACRVVVKNVGLMGRRRTGEWDAQRMVSGGRGNLRVAKTPPLQSAFAGMPLRIALRSRCCHCRCLHARAMPPMESHVFITEAEWEGRVPGGGRPFAAVSLLEYGGLQPILPFLGGRSDAACHVVIHLYAISHW